MDCQLTGLLSLKNTAAMAFGLCCLWKGSSLPVSGDEMCDEKPDYVTSSCWDPPPDRWQDVLVGWSAGRYVFSPVQV